MDSKWANKETIKHISTAIGYGDEVKASGMQMMYDILHRKHIEHAAAVKGMLALYKEMWKEW